MGGSSRHGDAVLVQAHGLSFLPKPADHLDFPKAPLGRLGVYRYRVADLPQVIYPTGFLLDVPEQEDEYGARHEHPWSRCIVRASLLSTDSRAFYYHTYHLGRDRAGSDARRRRRHTIYFSFLNPWRGEDARLPQYRSYILQIEVLRPSSRASDILAVDPYIHGDLKT